MAVAAHPPRSPDQQAGRVELHLHIRQGKSDRLILDDRATELRPLLGVVERVLVGGPSDTQRLGTDSWPADLKRPHRRLAPGVLPLPGPRQPPVELLLAAEQAPAGYANVVEEPVGG